MSESPQTVDYKYLDKSVLISKYPFDSIISGEFSNFLIGLNGPIILGIINDIRREILITDSPATHGALIEKANEDNGIISRNERYPRFQIDTFENTRVGFDLTHLEQFSTVK